MKKIKEVIRITGLSRRTLQYYDDCNLVKTQRTKENYRLYGEDELRRLWQILLYKEMGFRLDEIAEILNGDEETVYSKLEERIIYINQKIQDLERMKVFTEKILNYGMPEPLSAEHVAELGNYKEGAGYMAEHL